jgi:glutamine synthetase
MSHLKLEYVWLDGYAPLPHIRSKTMIRDAEVFDSGMHTNFSTRYMRETGGEACFNALAEGFGPHNQDHLAVYGAGNEMHLTGAHETASFEEFKFGVSDRGASIRIPIYTVEHGWKGYLEDRRPASNADPYRVTARIIETVREAHDKAR